jgi:Putative phage tail protein
MGSFITGSNGANTQQVIKYDALQVGTSQYDIAIPIFWGQRRLSYNCVWYNNFKAKKVSAKGKGGTLKGPSEYSYSAAVILAICEGVVDSIVNVWEDSSTTVTTTLSNLDLAFVSGTATQAVNSWLETNYPTQALSYARTAYFISENFSLGMSASVPNNAFEGVRLNGFTDTLTAPGWTDPYNNVNTPGVDCSMADILPDWLTNAQYGMGFVSGDIPDLTQFRAYQDGQGLYFSPYLVNQETATDIIDRWAENSNTWIYWLATTFMFVPLGDSAVGSYVPDLTAAYDLTLDDFVDDVPVKVTRKDPADCKNRTVLQFTDRTLGYVGNNAEYRDQTLYDLYGNRDDSSTQKDEICNPAVAQICAQLIGKRAAYIRNTFEFKTSYRYICLIPGSIVTLTDANAGLNQFRVRITEVSEDEDSLSFKAEELPALIGTYFPSDTQGNSNVGIANTLAPPGDINTPAIVEPSSAFSNGIPQLLIAASGGIDWGGCTVYVSFDGVNYSNIGTIETPAIQGVLTSGLPSHADPDTVDTLAVDMTETETTPSPVTTSDADADRTLSLVAAQPSLVGGSYVIPVNGELLSFGDVTTTGTYAANLTYLRRGQYGSAISAHSTGDQFTLLDTTGETGSTITYDLPIQYIGVPIYFKFSSFNTFSQANQDLSSILEYQYTPTGLGYGTGGSAGLPGVPSGLTASAGAGQIYISWAANASTDNVTFYKLYVASGTGSPFSSATLISQGIQLNYTQTGLTSGSAFTYFVEAVNAVGSSSHSAGVSATASTPTIVLTNGDIFVGNSSNDAVAVAMSGDATLSNTGTITVTKSGGVAFGSAAFDSASSFDTAGAAATAQTNAETYAASQASTAQSNAETYAAAQASTAQSNAETYAASQAAAAQAAAIAASAPVSTVAATTVAGLPGSPTIGARGFVTDSTQTLSAGLGSAVVGSGSHKTPVYYDGSTWLIG